MSSGQGNAEIAENVGTTLTTLHEAPIVAHALRADGFDASEDGTGRGTPLVPVGFTQNQREEVREVAVAGALSAEPGMKQQTYIAFGCKDAGQDAGDTAPTLRAMGHAGSHANAGGQVAVAFSGVADPVAANQGRTYTREGSGNFRMSNVAHTTMQVRRLTPRECERLQGFKDDYTLIAMRGKPAADGPRYKALGNSFAVPVIAWIGRQIEAAAKAVA